MSRMGAIAAGLLLAAGPAAAQGQPELLFQAEAQTLAGTCTGQPVRVDGNHNSVTLSGACGSLLLRGLGNTVRLGVVAGGSIRVEGSGNRVEYAARGAPPAIVALGPDNDVAAGSAPPAAPPRVTTPPGSAATSPAVPPVVSLHPSAQPVARPAPALVKPQASPLLLAGDDQDRLEQCAGQDVVITGNRSTYVVRGGCKSLSLRGDLLAVQVEVAPGARIAITGRGSIVSWVVKGRGHAPVSVVRGQGSRVQRADTIGGEPDR